MIHSCSLDEFIEKNKKEVRVGPGSLPIEFPKLGYRVPPGALFDLRVLRGEGYQLQTTEVDDKDISNGFGHAFILDQEGCPTGYYLGAHGTADPDGPARYSAYFIENVARAELDAKQSAKLEEKFGDIMYGPAEPKKSKSADDLYLSPE